MPYFLFQKFTFSDLTLIKTRSREKRVRWHRLTLRSKDLIPWYYFFNIMARIVIGHFSASLLLDSATFKL